MIDADAVLDDEVAIKRHVATVNRMLYMDGQVGPSGHVSIRHPEHRTAYLNPLSVPRGAIEPEDVVQVTFDGDPVDSTARTPVHETEIHTAIYRSRPGVTAVLHVHPEYLTYYAITGTSLLPVTQRGTLLAEGSVPILDRPGKIVTTATGEDMLEAMGDHKQLLLKNHGAVVCDDTIVRAFARAFALERNARAQHQASILGKPDPMSDEEVARAYEGNWVSRSIEKIWRNCEWRARKDGYLPAEW